LAQTVAMWCTHTADRCWKSSGSPGDLECFRGFQDTPCRNQCPLGATPLGEIALSTNDSKTLVDDPSRREVLINGMSQSPALMVEQSKLEDLNNSGWAGHPNAITVGEAQRIISEHPAMYMGFTVKGEHAFLQKPASDLDCEIQALESIKIANDGPDGAESNSQRVVLKEESLHAVSGSGNCSKIRVMLDSGTDVNVCDSTQRTALHWAAAKNRKHVVSLLIERKAQTDIADENGHAPIHVAAESGHRAVTALLLSSGVEVNGANARCGRSPLHFAAGSDGSHLDYVTYLLDQGAEVDAVDLRSGATPLHPAATNGFAKRVSLLLSRKASPDAVDGEGRTALQCAAASGHSDAVVALINSNASINMEDTRDGFAPLHLAVIKGHKGVIEALLQHGAQRSAKTKSGQTASDLAKNQGDDNTLRLLRDTPSRKK